MKNLALKFLGIFAMAFLLLYNLQITKKSTNDASISIAAIENIASAQTEGGENYPNGYGGACHPCATPQHKHMHCYSGGFHCNALTCVTTLSCQ